MVLAGRGRGAGMQKKEGAKKAVNKKAQDKEPVFVALTAKQERETDKFVSTVNTLVQNLGLNELPPVGYYRAKKIGIDTIPGLNIQHTWKDRDWTDGWGERAHSKKPFGKPYGDFEGKFEQNRGRRERRNVWDERRPRHFGNERRPHPRQREDSGEQFLKLGWKSGFKHKSTKGAANTRRKNKSFTRWESKGR